MEIQAKIKHDQLNAKADEARIEKDKRYEESQNAQRAEDALSRKKNRLEEEARNAEKIKHQFKKTKEAEISTQPLPATTATEAPAEVAVPVSDEASQAAAKAIQA